MNEWMNEWMMNEWMNEWLPIQSICWRTGQLIYGPINQPQINFRYWQTTYRIYLKAEAVHRVVIDKRLCHFLLVFYSHTIHRRNHSLEICSVIRAKYIALIPQDRLLPESGKLFMKTNYLTKAHILHRGSKPITCRFWLFLFNHILPLHQLQNTFYRMKISCF